MFGASSLKKQTHLSSPDLHDLISKRTGYEHQFTASLQGKVTVFNVFRKRVSPFDFYVKEKG